MTTKKISFENTMLGTLKGTNFFRTIDELITKTARFGEPDWTRKQVATTINRLIRKGANIKVRDARSPKVSYKYEVAEELFVSTDPTETESLVQPLDAVLDRVQNITKPVKAEEPPDLFSDEEIEANSPITVDIDDITGEGFPGTTENYTYTGTDQVTGKRVSEDCTFVPFADLPDDADKSVYEGVADVLMKMESERYPKPTTESLMHFIMSHKPKAIKVYAIQNHYGLSLADAACLMIKTGEEFDCLHVVIKELRGVAL